MGLKTKRTDAYNVYLNSFQSVLSCVTSRPLARRRCEDTEELFLVNSPVRLKGSDLLFSVTQYFRIVNSAELDDCAVRTESYTYEILDSITQNDLFCFHWEPNSTVQYPHIHLGFAAKGHGLPIDNKAHIPSGRVAIEDVVAFLIKDLGVKPLTDNWITVVGLSRGLFYKNKKW